MGRLVQGRTKKTKKAVSTIIPQQRGSKYTNEQRRAVIAEYIVTGSITKTAEMNNMPKQTVSNWANSDWGVELIGQLRTEKGEEIDANFTKLIDSAFEQAQDRVENGDFRLTKDNELIRVPMGGRDLVMSGAIVFDKQRLHRNQATQINAKAGDEFTKSFIEEFTQIAQTFKEKQARVVSTQGRDDEA